MAVFRKGDMWTRYGDAGLFLIPTCNVLNGKRLVMGRGIAKQANDRFPGIDAAFGDAVWSILSDGENKRRIRQDYYLLVSKDWPKKKLGAFQTKRHYRNDASIELITTATTALKWWSIYHYDTLVCLNYPGIGLGNLTKEVVAPIISNLPDNVEIWTYE